MKYLLDTNICIYWFKGLMNVDKKAVTVDINEISVSAITIAELLYGAYNSANIEKNVKKVKEFKDTTNIIYLNHEILEQYAKIKATLRAEGKILDDFDILIAATAIMSNCTLVTNNEKHFERITSLRTENWTSQ